MTYTDRNGTKYFTVKNPYGVIEIHALKKDNGKSMDVVVAKRNSMDEVTQYFRNLDMNENIEYYAQCRERRNEIKFLARKSNIDRFFRLFETCYNTHNLQPRACTRDDRRKLLDMLGRKKYGNWDEAVLNDREVAELYEEVVQYLEQRRE